MTQRQRGRTEGLRPTSFTSLPLGLVLRARTLASSRGVRLYEVYGQAVEELAAKAATPGRTIAWRASTGTGKPSRGVWLMQDRIEEIRRLSDLYHVRRVTVFLTALHEHLEDYESSPP